MNFAGHSLLGLLVGAIAGLAVAGVAPTTLGLPLLVPTAVLVLVYLGAVYPDIDLRDSIPRKRLRPYLGALAVAGVTLLATLRWSWFVAAGEAALGAFDIAASQVLAGGVALGVGAIAAVLLVDPALGALTGAHRTRTHSLTAHALLAGIAAVPLWLLMPDHPVVSVLPFAFVLGVAVHRVADDV